MLKKRLIPKLLFSWRKTYRGLKPVLVVTNRFSSSRAIGDPLSQAKIFESNLADELLLINLDNSEVSWPIFLKTLGSISTTLSTPLAVGGGIRTFDQVKSLFCHGADKIILNTGAIDQPSLISDVASVYGTQSVVVNIDYCLSSESQYSIYSSSGTIKTSLDLQDWIFKVVALGAGEIFLNSIDRDGTCNGLDIGTMQYVRSLIRVPVILSGGCGLSSHFVDGYKAGADAVAAGTFFCTRDQSPMQCRSHINNAGVPIRLQL